MKNKKVRVVLFINNNALLNDEILAIKDKIINAVPVEKLYLFGSYAYGTPVCAP